MKRIIFYLSISFFGLCHAGAHVDASHSDKIIKNIITYIKNDDKVRLANLIRYPISRKYPLTPIWNKSDFIEKYDTIFDEAFKKKIPQIPVDINELICNVSWRGIGILSGDIWIEQETGKITTINYVSDSANKLWRAEVQADAAHFYYPLRNNIVEPVWQFQTQTGMIGRIDEIQPNGQEKSSFRLALWKTKKDILQKPDVLIVDGHLRIEGSAGAQTYTFKDKAWTYSMMLCDYGTGDPLKDGPFLEIEKNEQQVMRSLSVYFSNQEHG